MNITRALIGLLLTTSIAHLAQANRCGEEVYNKHGMYRKYTSLPLDLSENWKKHGMSSSFQGTTETSTASTDPGVSTGVSVAQQQSTSTKGPCKWYGAFGSVETKDFQNYVEQNLNEIKNQIAVGHGGHIEMLAEFSGCRQSRSVAQALGSNLQKNMAKFVDLNESQASQFINQIENLISHDAGLASQCGAQQVAGY